MKITVIICTYNRPQLLKKTLQSLVSQSVGKNSFFVLVIDNGYNDSARAIVANYNNQLNIKYYFENKIGLSQARNRGIKESVTNYVAFIDDDSVADKDWLKNILNDFLNMRPVPAAVGGRINVKYESDKPQWINHSLESFLGRFDLGGRKKYLENDGLRGGNMAFVRKVLFEMGGFNTKLGRVGNNLLSNDEELIFQKIRKKNLPVFYNPKILVWHKAHRERLRKKWFYRRYFWQGVSEIIMKNEFNPAKSFFEKYRAILYETLMLMKNIAVNLPTSFFTAHNFFEISGILCWRAGKIVTLIRILI